MRSVLSIAAGVSVLVLSAEPTFGQSAERVAYDLTGMYDAVNPSIVKVHADGSSGSGFLVRPDGLIATNHHVVRNSRYLAVEFPNGRKVTTEIVLLDARHDLAILKVNQSVVADLAPLLLLPADRDPSVRAGIPAVAFGSPLTQTFLMTQGIVSKVEANVLFGDFLIQPGNSGGPLVNLEGLVIGVNTFGAGRTSGAVRVNILRDILASSRLAEELPEPSDAQLPGVGIGTYPTEPLKLKVLNEEFEERNYRLDGGRFTITALTPVHLANLNVRDDLRQASNRYSRRAKKIRDEQYDPVDEPFYDWLRDADDYLDLVVRFDISPDFGQTAGSMWASALNSFAAGMSQTVAQPIRQTYEFKAEFADFKLYRDGEFVEPIHPGRAITSQLLDSRYMNFVDEAYSGVYSYGPEVFLTGAEWRIEVYDAREPERVHRIINLDEESRLVQQLRQDFAEITSVVSLKFVGKIG